MQALGEKGQVTGLTRPDRADSSKPSLWGNNGSTSSVELVERLSWEPTPAVVERKPGWVEAREQQSLSALTRPR
jgi:hypothetical protein